MGEAGPRESEPVIYHWPWYWHLPRPALWLLLALAVALPRTNRDRRALLIFIPLLVLSLLWRLVAKGMGMGAGDLEEFSLFFESLVVGTALLWLNADKLSKYHGLMRFVMSLGMVLLAGLVGVVAYGRTSSDDAGPLLGLIVVMGVVLLAALTATRRLAHGRYEPGRFMLHLAIWSILCSTLGIIAVFLVLETLAGFPKTPDPQSAITEAIRPGLILGVCLYAINLPYMLLVFRSPFFRRRFCAWLGVTSPPQQGCAESTPA
jgi:uncharacterized membrane protein YidH (DUF202 family)